MRCSRLALLTAFITGEPALTSAPIRRLFRRTGHRFLAAFLRYARLAAPASTATPPRAKSRVSWTPAVPPPPVAGAAVGSVLADGLGVTGAAAVGVADGDAGLLAGGLALPLAGLPAVLLDETAGVGEAGPAGENEVGAGGGADPVHAETAAEASMAMVLLPMTAANLALSPVPAMAVRTFMQPPHPCPVAPPLPVPAPATGPRKQKRDPAAAVPAADRSPETATAIKVKAHGRHRPAMGSPLNIRLREHDARGKM